MEQLEAFYTMLSPRTRRSPSYIPQNQPTGLNIPAHAAVNLTPKRGLCFRFSYPRVRGGEPRPLQRSIVQPLETPLTRW